MPNDSKDLINLLVEKRKQLKLTQNKLSKKVDVSHTSIARIENGEMNPTLSLFISIANELGYDLILQKIEQGENNSETIYENDDIIVLKKTKNRKK